MDCAANLVLCAHHDEDKNACAPKFLDEAMIAAERHNRRVDA